MPITGGELPEFDPSQADATGVVPQMSFGCLVGFAVLLGFCGITKGLVKFVDWCYDDDQPMQQIIDKKIQNLDQQKTALDTLGAQDTLRIMNTIKNQKSK